MKLGTRLAFKFNEKILYSALQFDCDSNKEDEYKSQETRHIYSLYPLGYTQKKTQKDRKLYTHQFFFLFY